MLLSFLVLFSSQSSLYVWGDPQNTGLHFGCVGPEDKGPLMDQEWREVILQEKLEQECGCAQTRQPMDHQTVAQQPHGTAARVPLGHRQPAQGLTVEFPLIPEGRCAAPEQESLPSSFYAGCLPQFLNYLATNLPSRDKGQNGHQGFCASTNTNFLRALANA